MDDVWREGGRRVDEGVGMHLRFGVTKLIVLAYTIDNRHQQVDNVTITTHASKSQLAHTVSQQNTELLTYFCTVKE